MVRMVGDYPWNSHKGYLSGAKKWSWLHKEPVLSLLGNDRGKRLGEYRKFINEKDSKEMVDFYSKKALPAILGSLEFIDWIRSRFSDLLFKEEIPASKNLAPGINLIKEIVCKAYAVDVASLVGLSRGRENEPRDVAIFLARRLRRDSLRSIGEVFGISNYSSVSTIIEGMKGKIPRDRKLKKQIAKLKQRLT